MGFFRKHFGKDAPADRSTAADPSASKPTKQSSAYKDDSKESQYAPPPGPPPSQQVRNREEVYAPPPGPPPGSGPSRQYAQNTEEAYAPPPGPPPRRSANAESTREEAPLPPVGPPPSWRQAGHGNVEEEYAPPPGPPPSQRHRDGGSAGGGGGGNNEEFAPPPGPPPGRRQEEQPQQPAVVHDWQSAVPDTSLLPPPPALASNFAPNSNADNADARQAWDWCKANKLYEARPPPSRLAQRSRTGELPLQGPSARYPGSVKEVRPGVWRGTTKRGAGDQCFLTGIPAYFALGPDAPKVTERAQQVYLEVRIDSLGRPDAEGNAASLAVGFAAAPYPTWRMPGWERGSLAVHSDDGRRYVNNQDGGQDFVDPVVAPGTTVGLGIRYRVPSHADGAAPTTAPNGLAGEAFFTRNGRLEGSWSLQEEMDQSSEYGAWGIEGDHDLYGAVGTFGEMSFTAVFKPEEWLYKLPQQVGSQSGREMPVDKPPEYSR